MPFTIVNSVTIRPALVRQFEEAVGELASQAAQKRELWQWTGHQAVFGDTGTMHFAYQADDFASLEKLGTLEELYARVLGEERGREVQDRANECVESGRHTVSIERADLSYPPDQIEAAEFPLAIVTTARVRPGRTEECEELIRKIAEAIPKVDDPARIISYQTVLGDLNEYWTVRPLRELAELDRHRPAPELLNQAFGAAEGGLIWRAGSEAIQEVQRQVMSYREDLSNPPRD